MSLEGGRGGGRGGGGREEGEGEGEGEGGGEGRGRRGEGGGRREGEGKGRRVEGEKETRSVSRPLVYHWKLIQFENIMALSNFTFQEKKKELYE